MSQGTRRDDQFYYSHIESGRPNGRLTRDLGLKERVLPATVTFVAATKRATGSNGDFVNFKLNDNIVINGTGKNNGYQTITGVDGVNNAFLTLDQGVQDEAGVLTAEIRIM